MNTAIFSPSGASAGATRPQLYLGMLKLGGLRVRNDSFICKVLFIRIYTHPRVCVPGMYIVICIYTFQKT